MNISESEICMISIDIDPVGDIVPLGPLTRAKIDQVFPVDENMIE